MVFLSDRHRAELHASGLSDATIERRGYATATAAGDFEFALDEKKMTRNQLGAGLVIPVYEYGHSGECSQYIVKLDTPRKIDGRELKYETRKSFSSPIDVGRTGTYGFDADIVITEGIKKGDALREVFPGALVLAVNGVHSALQTKRNWKTLRKDVQEIFAGRENAKIFFCFDSDLQSNPDVWQGVDRMRAALDLSGYKSKIVLVLPDGEKKVGIDDFLVAHGPEAVKFLFELAADDMPLKPVRRGERARKSANKEESEQLLQEYQTFLDEQSIQLADVFAVDLWLKGVPDLNGETIEGTAQGDTLVFDRHSLDVHLFDADNCVYHRRPDDDAIVKVSEWFKGLIDLNFILVPPNRQRFPEGIDGETAHRKAVKARASQVTAIASVMKARNVFSLLRGTAAVQKVAFNLSTHHHLVTLTGGKSIDLSKPPATGTIGCPTAKTPVNALFTYCSPVTVEQYEQAILGGKTPTRFLKFIEEISDGDPEQVEAILGFLGYCLHGRRKQRFFILHGQGRNGKGILMAILCFLLGEAAYQNKSVAKAFAGRDERHDQHWLEHRYRRVVSAPDPTGYLNEGNLLAYAGGDLMPGEKKGGLSVDVNPSGALVMHGQSDRIKFRSSDDAIRYRMLAMVFNKQFVDTQQDGRLFDDLKSEAPQILSFLSQYAHDYHRDGVFAGEEFWQEGRENLIRISNPIFEFLDNQGVYETCEDSGTYEVTVANFIAHYQKWCKMYSVKPLGNTGGEVVKMLKTAWSNIFEERHGRSRKTYLHGIKFTKEAMGADRDPNGNIDVPESSY